MQLTMFIRRQSLFFQRQYSFYVYGICRSSQTPLKNVNTHFQRKEILWCHPRIKQSQYWYGVRNEIDDSKRRKNKKNSIDFEKTIGEMDVVQNTTPNKKKRFEQQNFDNTTYNISVGSRVLKEVDKRDYPPQKIIQFIKTLQSLGRTNNRDLTLLKTICQALTHSSFYYIKNDIVEIYLALSKLAYPDVLLLNALASTTVAYINSNELSLKDVRCLLHCLYNLKYRNVSLIDTFDKFIMNNSAEDPTTLLKSLLTHAHLNINSSATDFYIQQLSKFTPTDHRSFISFLNYVWAVVILGKESLIPENHIEQVLSDDYYKQLIHLDLNHNTNILKLLNISLAASKLPNYKGPLFDEKKHDLRLTFTPSELYKLLKDSLSYIFRKDEYVAIGNYVGGGIFLDLQCCLNSEAEPVELYKNTHTKVGIKFAGFKDWCLCDKEVTGLYAFQKREILRQKFKLVEINYNELKSNSSMAENVLLIKSKLKEVVTQN